MILITGAEGQVGSDLADALRARHGAEQVLETDLRAPASMGKGRLFETLDVTDQARFDALVKKYNVDTIYHLAGVLSARGEQHPDQCWQVNVYGLRNALEVAKAHQLKLFWPSSIAVFGPHTPKQNTPQATIQDPKTMYGISKVTGEMLGEYYANKFGVDVRSLRLPGVISHTAPPGGGTTDFAVEIFYEALQYGNYTSFVGPKTRLPMMYMPDTLKAILDLMDADAARISVRTSYNITAVSFSAEELVAEIQQHLPDFTCTYQPDFRQAIADSWPSVIDDVSAREDWDWQHAYGLSDIVTDMLEKLRQRFPQDGKANPPSQQIIA